MFKIPSLKNMSAFLVFVEQRLVFFNEHIHCIASVIAGTYFTCFKHKYPISTYSKPSQYSVGCKILSKMHQANIYETHYSLSMDWSYIMERNVSGVQAQRSKFIFSSSNVMLVSKLSPYQIKYTVTSYYREEYLSFVEVT